MIFKGEGPDAQRAAPGAVPGAVAVAEERDDFPGEARAERVWIPGVAAVAAERVALLDAAVVGAETGSRGAVVVEGPDGSRGAAAVAAGVAGPAAEWDDSPEPAAGGLSAQVDWAWFQAAIQGEPRSG